MKKRHGNYLQERFQNISGMDSFMWCHFNSDLFQSTYFLRMSPSLNTILGPPYSGRTLSLNFQANWLNLSTVSFRALSTATTVAYNTFLEIFLEANAFFWLQFWLHSLQLNLKRVRKLSQWLSCSDWLPQCLLCSHAATTRRPPQNNTFFKEIRDQTA